MDDADRWTVNTCEQLLMDTIQTGEVNDYNCQCVGLRHIFKENRTFHYFHLASQLIVHCVCICVILTFKVKLN